MCPLGPVASHIGNVLQVFLDLESLSTLVLEIQTANPQNMCAKGKHACMLPCIASVIVQQPIC